MTMPTLSSDTHPDSLNPRELEQAWRSDPAAFTRWLDAALAQHPTAALLQAWHERLYWQEAPRPQASNNSLLYTVFIATLVWACAKLPDYVSVAEAWFYPRFVPWLVITGLASWFLVNQTRDRKLLLQGGGALGAVLLALLLLPYDNGSDSITMALIHVPLLLLSIFGFVFGAGRWRDIGQRIGFIRYGGEALILAALVIAGGGVLTGLTLALFNLIGIDLGIWMFEYVVLWGGLSAPLVATWLWDQVLQRQSRLAPMIANVFSPLFLLMTVAYLLALLSEQRSPFNDRDFLIVFNALLLVVWGITVFSVIGRSERPSRLLDVTNLSLVAVTLVVDAIALAAIVYRTAEFGITPNRIAVTGANLLIFIHLVWILVEYAKAFQRGGSAQVLTTTIARYLPVYTGWSLFVVLVLPLLFGFA
jgi:hypothetical protein